MSHSSFTNPLGPGSPAAANAPASAPVQADVALQRLVLVRGPHRWTFRWTTGDEHLLIARAAELARDSHAAFDWYDAAVLSRCVMSGATPIPTPLPPDSKSA